MRKLFIAASIIVLASCASTPASGTFGDKFEKNSVMTADEATASFMAGRDTIYQVSGEVEAVCQHGACWLDLKTADGKLRIDTDEQFKLPKDGKGKNAVVNGKFEKKEDGKLRFHTTGVIIE